MELITPTNPGYCATVVKVTKVNKLKSNKKNGTQACDNLVGLPFFGFQAITGNDVKVGDLGVLFTTETELSDVFCKTNNLYRHSEKNLVTDKKGYIEDNRRIRAQKFRGHVSNALFMSLSSFAYYGVNPGDFKEGDTFEGINGLPVCQKYVVPVKTSFYTPAQKKASFVDARHLPEHFTTPNFFKMDGVLDDKENVIVTQKLHGTSVRIAHTYVDVAALGKVGLMYKLARALGVPVKRYEMQYVFGSRKVVKDINNVDQVHYYDEDIWTKEGKNYVGVIPQNFVVYAEIVGKLSTGAEIQKDYSYGLANAKTYVYRVVTINEQGVTTDLAWDQVKEFCEKYGMLHVPELWRGTMKEFKKKTNLKKFIDTALYKKFPTALPVGDGLVDEGVCVRADRMTPIIMKAKSPIFYEHETKMLDKGEADLESTQS